MQKIRVGFSDSSIEDVPKFFKLLDGIAGFKIEQMNILDEPTTTEYDGYSVIVEIGYDSAFGLVTAILGKISQDD